MRTIFRAKAHGGVTPREADRREAALRAAHAGAAPIKLFPPSLIAEPIGGPAGEAHAEFVRQLNGAHHQDEPANPGGAPELVSPVEVEQSAVNRAVECEAVSGNALSGPAEHIGDVTEKPLPLLRIIRDDGAPPDIWIKSADGLKRWRPIVDAWRIHELPEGGRLIEITGGRPLRLDGDLAAHFAWLMMPEEWRIALGDKFGAGR